MKRASMARRARRAGFTMLELMIALTAGALVISATYIVGASTQRNFHEQQRISTMQMGLRNAMEFLRKDIARAGYLSTPNSDVDITCRAPVTRVRAITHYDNEDDTVLPNYAENLVEADRLFLTGNYVTNESFLASALNDAGDTVFLQSEWQSFRRAFGVPFNATLFSNAFKANRMLMLRNQAGNYFFVNIVAADPATRSVRFDPPLGIGGTCVGGLMEGATVAPISGVRLGAVSLAGSAHGSALAPADMAKAEFLGTGASAAALVRNEADFAGGVLAGTERVIVENLANFSLTYLYDAQPVRGGAPILQIMNGAVADALLDPPTIAGSLAHMMRMVRVSLSVRAEEQDPRFPFVKRSAGQPLTRYRATTKLPGSARVRTLNTEIFLPNIANRGLR